LQLAQLALGFQIFAREMPVPWGFPKRGRKHAGKYAGD
jgi:hypothetical protein